MFVSDDRNYPPPLSRESETETIIRAMSGDANARTTMILHNMRLVIKTANRYVNDNHPLEDMVSIGTIGLIKAVDSYNPSLGYRFSTYAARCINNQLLMFLRKERRQPMQISLDAAIYEDEDGSTLRLDSILSTDTDPVGKNIERAEERIILAKCLNRLNTRHRHIINMRYCENPLTQAEISKMWGVSASYVSRLEKQAIQRLKKELLKHYDFMIWQ